MMYIRFANGRYIVFSEYRLLLPAGILAYLMLRRVLKRRRKAYIEVEGNASLEVRGGETENPTKDSTTNVNNLEDKALSLIEGKNPNCIEGRINYIKNKELIEILFNQYREKVRNGVLYMTKSSFCHFLETHNLDLIGLGYFLINYLPIGIGVTSVAQLVRKTLVIGGVFTGLLALEFVQNLLIKVVLAGVFFTSSITLYRKPEYSFLVTPGIGHVTMNQLTEKESSTQNEVVVIDLSSNYNKVASNYNKVDKIMMEKIPYECSLPDQVMNNPKCKIENRIFAVEKEDSLYFNYNDVVNLQTVSGIEVDFADIAEVGLPPADPTPTNAGSLRGSKKPSKEVSFLKKYGDPEIVSKEEQWETNIAAPQSKTPEGRERIQINEDEL